MENHLHSFDPQTKIIGEAITFDDVLLVPQRSDFVPADADVRTFLTRSIELNIPLLSAPMDTVTESALAIALAQEGGIGFIHKNMPIEVQCREVDKVKRSENGIIFDPVTLSPEGSVAEARRIMREQNISGIPIVLHGNGGVNTSELVGILTRRDLKFHEGNDNRPVRELMSKANLVTAPVDTTLEQAEHILNSARVEKLLLVDDRRRLVGMITMRDIDKTHQFPRACKDARAVAGRGGGGGEAV